MTSPAGCSDALLLHIYRVATTNTRAPLRVELVAINRPPRDGNPFRYRLTLYRHSGRTGRLDMPVHSIAIRNTARALHNALLDTWQALVDWDLPANTPASWAQHYVATELRYVRLYATAHDLVADRITLTEVAHRLRRDAPKTTEPTRSRRLALAASIEAHCADAHRRNRLIATWTGDNLEVTFEPHHP